MSRINDFLTEAGVFFLATEDGLQPKVRPLGAHIESNGRIYFTVGDFKEVYRQMTENPRVEIVAFTSKDRMWLRYTGRAVFEDNDDVREQVFQRLPHLRNAYNETTGHKMMLFYLEDATAMLMDISGNGGPIE